jgi:hypothetical protein
VKSSRSKHILRIETAEARKVKLILSIGLYGTCHSVIETKDQTWMKEIR